MILHLFWGGRFRDEKLTAEVMCWRRTRGKLLPQIELNYLSHTSDVTGLSELLLQPLGWSPDECWHEEDKDGTASPGRSQLSAGQWEAASFIHSFISPLFEVKLWAGVKEKPEEVHVIHFDLFGAHHDRGAVLAP